MIEICHDGQMELDIFDITPAGREALKEWEASR